ncbi:MAG: sigma-70 family RNA polymerase sigma factor [Pyrinomonadaceae bacterium]|nr:sigma-70 family RNA polymerase sigma factor [Pyrinomonadaceae bacterium]
MYYVEDKTKHNASDFFDAFDNLLKNFAPDRDEAGRLYSNLRTRLERWFEIKGLSAPDAAADLTLERLQTILFSSRSEPVKDINGFAFGIAKRVFLERQRAEIKQRRAFEKLYEKPEIKHDVFESLVENCLARLDPDEQDLLFNYYLDLPFAESVAHRSKLAASLATNVNNLRQKVLGIKRKLNKLIEAERKAEKIRTLNARRIMFTKRFSKVH